MKRPDIFVLVVVAVILVLFTFDLADAIITENAKPEPVVEMAPYYPEIPQCDKELWDRIKDGCE